jgi:RHS repeat-associated protein
MTAILTAVVMVLATFDVTPVSAASAPTQDGWAAVPAPGEEELAYPKVFGAPRSVQVASALGAVSDQIPIVVPPGRRGVEPDLMLAFNSAGGLGELGLGWSVTGIGHVEPARRDGTPSVGDPDVYQFAVAGLGGELRDAGAGVYRASEEQAYREFRKVPGGWEMRDGGGSRTFFGTTPESRVVDADGVVQRWLVEHAEDPSGNAITYDYLDDGGSRYLAEIRYTGHVPTGDPGTNRVVFEYESRDDSRISYRSATRQELALRLARITVEAGDELVRRYELGYRSHPLNGQSLLSTVTLVGADDQSRIVLRSLEYSARSLGWAQAGAGIPYDLADDEGNDTGTRVADVNGDGFADVVSNDAEVHLGDGSGGFGRDDAWSASANAFLAASRRGGSPWSSAGLFEVTVEDTSGGDSAVRLQDVNGDGLPDLFFARTLASAGTFPLFDHLVWLNTGTGWQQDDQWTASLAEARDPTPWVGPGVGDGLEPVTFADCGSFHDSIPAWRGVQLVDVNGDGLVDIVWAERRTEPEYAPCTLLGSAVYDHVSVFLNTGSGWSRNTELSDALRDLREGEDTWLVFNGQLQGFDLVDVNGDGLADVVRTLENQPREVFLATGHGWERDTAYSDSLSATPIVSLECDDDPCGPGDERTGAGLIPADIDDDGLVDYLLSKEGAAPQAFRNTGSGWVPSADMTAQLAGLGLAFATDDGKSTGITLADIDGDGISDFVRARDGQRSTWASGAIRSGLLTRSTSALGEVTELTWASSTAFDNRRVDGVVQGLPMAVPVPVSLTRRDGLGNDAVTSFDYEGGLFADRAFRGFRRATVTGPTGFTTEQDHYQDDGLVGMVREQRGIDSQGILRNSLVSDYQQAGVPPQVRQTTLASTEETVHDPGGQHTTRIEYRYDDRLNAEEIVRDQDVSAPGDETRAVVSFARNDAAAIWSLPVRTVVSALDGSVVSDQTNRYDGLAAGAVDRGLLTGITERVDGVSTVSRSLRYDEFGVLSEEVDSRGAVTRFSYDPTGTYRISGVDPMGREVRSAYDVRFGDLVSDADAAGNVETRSYDVFGRLSRVELPGDGSTPAGRRTYTYSAVGEPAAQSYRVDEVSVGDESAPLTTAYFFDGLGQIYRTESGASAGRTVVSTVEYDESGNPTATSRPFFAGDTPAVTRVRYDEQNRPVEAVEPDGTTMTVSYRGLQVDVTGPRGSTTRYEKNADGDITAVHNWVDGAEQVARYGYDAAGRLTTITDPMGSQTRIGYDNLGNRTALEDPNAGTYTYEYDGDRLVAETAPDGGTSRFVYDEAGDLLREELPSGEVLSFTYGSPGSGQGTGRLVRTDDATGSVEITYDARGNAVERVRTVDDRQFRTRYDYDGLDRLVSTTYPDGYEVRYDYDTGGKLAKVTDNTGREVAGDFRYEAAGQLEGVRFGNGVQSSYRYDALQRMSAVAAAASDGRAVQDLAYDYDPASNVSAITDAVTGNTQSFEYDALDRLTGALGSAYGDRQYTYDAGGNLLRKGDLFFGSDPERPQRARCVVDTAPNDGTPVEVPQECAGAMPSSALQPARVFAVGYDERGNVTQKGDQRYDYDDRNQLIRARAADGAVTESNTYDASGELVVKQTTGVTTTFIDGIYEEVEGPDTLTVRHHVYAGSLLVATFETVAQQPTTEPLPPRTLPTTGAPTAALLALAGALLVGGGAALWAANRRRGWTRAHQAAAPPRATRTNRRVAATALILGLAVLAYGLAGSADSSSTPMPPAATVATTPGAGVALAGATHTSVEEGRLVTERDLYYHANHLGSIDAITDATGGVVERRGFEPYGEHSGWDGPGASPTGQRAGFGGHPEDDSTGLVDFGARRYDPELGRFLTADTEVPDPTNPKMLNRYAFAGGNPIRYIDPTGHAWYDWLIGALVFIAVAALAIAATIATGGTVWIAVAVIAGLAVVGAVAGGLVGYYALGLRGWDLAGAIGTGFLVGGIIGAGIVALPVTFAAEAGWLASMAADIAIGVAAGSIEKVIAHFGWEGGGPLGVSDFYQAWAVGAAAGLVAGQIAFVGGKVLGSVGRYLQKANWAKWTKALYGRKYFMPGGPPGMRSHLWRTWSPGVAKVAKVQRALTLSRLVPVRPGIPYLGEGDVTFGSPLSVVTYGFIVAKHAVHGVKWGVRQLR